ncbi:molecular chaperone DnaJ [Hoylesella nanceiensis]|uniref:molecular chaperone DnaJ n=1 Tax=Hoylesella nanceiensis TaxID=425941 RepID=UPI0028E4101F|nr:molecular chaperone DnaJ [Hoylesella nanceiensis]
MTTFNKFNANQFANLNRSNLLGVTLIYRRVNKEGVTEESAINFSGEGFTPENRKQNEVFKVWKNVVLTFWNAKIIEAGLKADNGGIALKLRSTTPAAIIVRTANGKAEEWDIEGSVWSRIGLMPTKKDIEACKGKEGKKKMHRAAVASFDALNFRVKFDDLLEKETETEETNLY